MQTLGPAPPGHEAAGEFVHDDDLAVLHDILLVAQKQVVRAQGGVQVVHQDDVVRGVQALAFGQQPAAREDLLDLFVAEFRHMDLVLFLVDPEIPGAFFLLLRREQRRDFVDALIHLRVVFCRAGDDERRARLVDEDGVHFVDDGVVETALAAILHPVFHVVAQVVKAEFVIGAVRDVGGIGGELVGRRLLRQDHAHAHAHEAVEASHPLRVAAGQVVIHRDEVHAFAGQGVEVDRQGGGEGLALARAHFGDLAAMEHHAAHELHVEVAHAEHALGGFADRGKSFRQELIDRFAGGKPGAEGGSQAGQLFVGQRRHGGFQGVDARDGLLVGLEQALVAASKYSGKQSRKHRGGESSRQERSAGALGAHRSEPTLARN